MTTGVIDKTQEIEMAIDTIKQYIAENYINSRDAIAALWPKLEMSQENLEMLAQEGLYLKLQQSYHIDRYLTEKENTEIVPLHIISAPSGHQTQPQIMTLSVFERVTYQDINGINKPIIKFTLVDIRAQKNRLNDNIQGMINVVESFTQMEEALIQHNTDCIENLPADVLKTLEQTSIWGQ